MKDLSKSMQRVENQRVNDLFALWEQESKTGCTTQTKNLANLYADTATIFLQGILQKDYITKSARVILTVG